MAHRHRRIARRSGFWIANAWMQYPVGMEFDPAQMRNVMDDFWALFSGIAINKFFHAVVQWLGSPACS